MNDKPTLTRIESGRNATKMIEAIEHLLASAKAGEIIGFAAVGIEPDDETRMWKGAVHGTTKLRMLGAMNWLLYCYSAQDDA